MHTQKTERILIVHNNDFPALESFNSEEPPSQEDSYLSGIQARAGVKIVADHIHNTLKKSGHENVEILPVTRLDEIKHISRRKDVDVIFNLCESLDSDPNMEIEIIKLLENGHARFTGNKTKPLFNCLNKFHCSTLLRSVDVGVPDFFVITHVNDLDKIDNPFELHSKYIVKPNAEDGSTGIDFTSVVHDRDQLKAKIIELLPSTKSGAIVQQYIEGREINLSVLDLKNDLYGFSEIDFSKMDSTKPRILNYASKWCSDQAEFHTTPSIVTTLEDKYKKRILDSAKKACKVLGINSYARLDYRVTPEGIPYIVDVNPNCDLDPTSGFSKAFGFRDIPYETIITTLVRNASVPKRRPSEKKAPGFILSPVASPNLNYEYSTN